MGKGKWSRSGRKKPKKGPLASDKVPIAGFVLPGMVHEPSIIDQHGYSRSRITTFAKQNRNNQTPAEREFRKYLLSLNGGVLRGRFKEQHVISGRWILDFFFPEIRLGIEIDGSIHATSGQRKRDRLKDSDCKRFDVTLLRISNYEVFGNKERLRQKLRRGWRTALDRENTIIGKPDKPRPS